MGNLDEIMDEVESSVNEDTSKHTVRHLFDKVNTKQIMLKTQVDRNEVNRITKLKAINDMIGDPRLSTLTDTFMKLRVSLDRQGRNELVKALENLTDVRSGAKAFSMFGRMPLPQV